MCEVNSKGHVIAHVQKVVNPVRLSIFARQSACNADGLSWWHVYETSKSFVPYTAYFLGLCRPAHSNMTHYQILTRISLVYLGLNILIPYS